MADQALAAVQMMDFDDKNRVTQMIQQNGTMYQQILMMQQQMLQMAEIIDRTQGTNMAEQLAGGITGEPVQPFVEDTGADTVSTQHDGSLKEENKVVEDARAQSQAASQPR